MMSLLAMIAIRLLYRVPVLKPEQIDESMIGRDVIVEGVVTHIRQGKTTFMKLNSMDVVFFDNVSAEKGEWIRVYGKVSEYKGRLEVVGKRILARNKNREGMINYV